MTKNDWILDVLADLKAFASSNGLFAISEQLDDTMLIAASELASQKDEVATSSNGEAESTGPCVRGAGCHRHA